MRLTTAFLVLLLAAPSLNAQSVLPTGTGAGWGLSALLTSRGPEAGLWNPALLAASSSNGYDWAAGQFAASVSTTGYSRGIERAFAGDLSWVEAPYLPTSITGRVDGVLLGSSDGPMAFVFTGHAGADIALPSSFLRLADVGTFSGDPSFAPSRYFYALRATMARGVASGRLPVLGDVFLGFSGHATSYLGVASGAVRWDREDVLNDVLGLDEAGDSRPAAALEFHEFDGFYGFGMDLGLLLSPHPQLLLGATITNAALRVTDPADHVTRRWLYVRPGRSTPFAHYATSGAISDLNATELERSADAYANLTPGRVVRIAGMASYREILISSAYAHVIRDGFDLIGSPRYSASVGLSHDLMPRVTFSENFQGSYLLGASMEVGFCSGQISIGAGRRFGSMSGVDVTLGWIPSRSRCF